MLKSSLGGWGGASRRRDGAGERKLSQAVTPETWRWSRDRVAWVWGGVREDTLPHCCSILGPAWTTGAGRWGEPPMLLWGACPSQGTASRSDTATVQHGLSRTSQVRAMGC